MNQASIQHQPTASLARSRASRTAWRSDAWIYLTVALLVGASYAVSHLGLYDARSDLGYWIGVVGAVMMVLLFAYPLRKRSATLSRWGKAKHWFIVHMVLGVLGPVLVLAHSAFQVGSLNAGVALFSMLIVAASGVVGRFIYLRIHRDLGGELQTLQSVQRDVDAANPVVRGALHFVPEAVTRLQALHRHAGVPRDSWLDHGHRLLVLPWQMWRERRSIRRLTRATLRRVGQRRAWDAATQRGWETRALALVNEYTHAVLRVAQLSAYSRLFSLWHVLHVPFVFLMVLCAIAHVVAVHAY